MSKITFRADDNLVDRVERLDASKSEVMREALRAYLDGRATGGGRDRGASDGAPASERPLDDLFAERLDALLAERLDALLAERLEAGAGQDIDLTVSLEGARDGPGRRRREPEPDPGPRGRPSDGTPRRHTVDREGRSARPEGRGDGPSDDGRACNQCGSSLSDDHVYCPNCGEKASRRVFCDCGDEVRTDWAFCPGCGRRTPAADVLDGP